MKYRTDIDGMRAIAVMAVLIFHAGIERLGGGYLGVDIFYVISGFLITGIIRHEIDDGSFTLAGFYRRRIVRILPALFAMLTAVLITACIVAMPPDIDAIGKSSAAAAGFVANIHFWLTTGYFDDAAEAAPLLHTWSLGVEEQFYILYPFLLIAIASRGRNPKWPLAALSVGSFLLALWMQGRGDGSDFYLLPARAWQLGLGALVAVGFFPKLRGAPALALATAGLGAMVAGFFVGSEFTVFMALLTSAGAALVIAYAEGTPVHRLLALPPMRWIGAISYSLYLWHWPIITFYRQYYGLDLELAEEAGLIGASILVAALSYYMVEQPALRRFRNAASGKTVAVGAIAIAAMIGVSLTIAANAGSVRDMPSEARRIAAYVNYDDGPWREEQARTGRCFLVEVEQVYDEGLCARFIPGKRNIALIGDSHAAQYWLALSRRFPQDNIMQATGAGCAILLGIKPLERCAEINALVFGRLAGRGRLDGVILAGRWTRHQLPFLKRTIAFYRARSIPVTVIGPVLEYEARFPIALAKAIEIGDATYTDRLRRTGIMALDKQVRKAATDAGASYYSVIDAECPMGRCAHVSPVDGAPLHFDYGHVTQSGADYVLRDLTLR